ncbi:hypothetical protein [Nocardioides sp. SYSU D00065]|uniref:hypothetical protein n=1 Tax=Nocardioides sp. SYSU D00065 TaxID=2817378 RepID=UPI001B341832|nr:hypothetical protein [Nocardioides sp. SYSU D00065]
MRTRTATGWLVASITAMGAGAGCSGDDRAPADDATTAGPVIAVRGWDAYPAAQVSGRLELAAGCLLVGDSVAFWADGTTWDATERAVVFDSGQSVALGDRFSGGGGHYGEAHVRGLEGVDADAVVDCLHRTGAVDAVFATPPAASE